jgi:hypothetical protein|tara:strand:+ start:24338 stop:24556 length:219 start_codon:yes stop_codon:yes gene_type:complete
VFSFLADIVKPALTIAVTIFLIVFVASVFSPDFDAWVQTHLPVWGRLDGIIQSIREWLGIAREDVPWWQFWR